MKPGDASEGIRGFPPLVAGGARVLILGSMPGVASLERQQYYGQPRNAFWPIMGELFGAGPELAYAQRTARLTAAGVAVWDVIASCVRPGSLDSAIEMASVAVNDFERFFRDYPAVRTVCFNGRKAEQVFRRRVEPGLLHDLQYVSLPSTSPALASMGFAVKLRQWRAVQQILERQQ